jgi:hypothetical protein
MNFRGKFQFEKIKYGFQNTLKIEKLSEGKYKLLSDLVYISKKYGTIIIPEGFTCDLASFKIGNFQLRGKSEEPSVLHDLFYSGTHKRTSRKVADELFLESLLSEKETRLKSTLYWLAVRLIGWKYYKK